MVHTIGTFILFNSVNNVETIDSGVRCSLTLLASKSASFISRGGGHGRASVRWQRSTGWMLPQVATARLSSRRMQHEHSTRERRGSLPAGGEPSDPQPHKRPQSSLDREWLTHLSISPTSRCGHHRGVTSHNNLSSSHLHVAHLSPVK
jgi:hypothetical protein